MNKPGLLYAKLRLNLACPNDDFHLSRSYSMEVVFNIFVILKMFPLCYSFFFVLIDYRGMEFEGLGRDEILWRYS